MLQNESRLLVVDNSGVKEILIINNSNRKSSDMGDLVIATAKKVIPNSKIKKGQIVKALIVNSKKGTYCSGGLVRFSKNCAVIVGVQKTDSKKIEPFQATRVFVPILWEFGERGYQKILSLAPEIV